MLQLPGLLRPSNGRELTIGTVATALDVATPIALQEAQRVRGATPGRVVDHHDGWPGATVAPVISNHRPEVSRLRALAPRRQDRRPGLVHEDRVSGLQMFAHLRNNGPQMEAGPADPVAQGGTVQGQPLTGVDLGLAVNGRWSPNFETMTCAISASVSMPPGSTYSGAYAWATAPEQRRQA